MDKSSRLDIALEDQRKAWNDWNRCRELEVGHISVRQAETIEGWLRECDRTQLNILDAGCGTGWMCQRLLRFGAVTGIDLADEVIQRARLRVPQARFLAGDALGNDELEPASFDVIVSLEVLSHVVDQRAFVAKLASLLKSGGRLMLATQNRPILERWSEIGGPIPGQVRRWVDAKGLRQLLSERFVVEHLTSVEPVGDQGYMRFFNSKLFNWPTAMVLGRKGRLRLKERMLLGHTLIVCGRVREGQAK
jgi:2-polyprenyl-3-methyl-5-hydroxy-6-metoxy-1,4-benzoquinol methylase